MNKHKLTITALAVITFVAVACKKHDVQAKPVSQTSQTSTALQWKSITNWTQSKQNEFTVHHGKIEDAAITTEVVSKGLVLVYKSNGSNILTLPAEEKTSKDNYWYYQVSKGAITISADAFGNDQGLNPGSFQYFILSANQLKELEAKGYSKSKLMGLSYADASKLLTK